MANLAASAVKVVEQWTEGGLNSRKHRVKRVTLTLTAQGTVANKIPASALGYKSLIDASPFVKSDNAEVVLASPSADGTFLLLKAGATAAPADLTGTYTGQVRGIGL